MGIAGFGFWSKYRFSHAERTFNWHLHTEERSEEDKLYEDLLEFDPNEPIYYFDWVQKHKEREERREKSIKND